MKLNIKAKPSSKECRQRRRKCVRDSVYDICIRCKRLEKECISSEEESDCSEYDNDIPILQKQVEELHLLLQEMENELYSLSACTSDSSDYDHDSDDNKQMIINSSIYNNANNNKHNNNKPWKVMFHNGSLRIETSIRSVSDLLMQCSPSWYPSSFQPSTFSEDDDDLMVRFDPGKTIRFVPLSIKLMVKCIAPTPNPIPLLLPAVFDVGSVVDELISIYFNCRNTYKPLIHEKTFMEYYRRLSSPLDSLVCLSICCTVCATPCNHIAHDPYKFRQLGDHFYALAKAKLMNQFDEPSKRLENLISINLLSEFIIATLKLEDFKNFVTIGYRICLDLESWFESTKDQGNTVERMLYSRHFMNIFLSQGLLSLITNEPMHYLSITYPEWLLADDDTPQTAHYVAIQNYLVKLQNNSYLNKIRAQIHHQLKGEAFSLKFESIIRLDDVLKEWWKSVPPEYYVCENWLDLEEAKIAVEKCQVEEHLALFNYFVVSMIDIYSSLLQPNTLETKNDQILSVVQELALRRCLHGCQLLICSQIKCTLLSDTRSCHSILAVNEYLFHTLDALIIMIFSTNYTIRTAAQEMLKQTHDMIDSVHFLKSHKVEAVHSPLLASVKAKDINSIDISEYFNYPQPWYALLSDLAHHLDKVQVIDGVPFLVDTSN
ncbi:hypothetical protein K501DRAFT_329267 [Backusella circina FSU 941]|nr:hypothetical protein K501DRAFT_329267 [Backusella circina FSU 941]